MSPFIRKKPIYSLGGCIPLNKTEHGEPQMSSRPNELDDYEALEEAAEAEEAAAERDWIMDKTEAERRGTERGDRIATQRREDLEPLFSVFQESPTEYAVNDLLTWVRREMLKGAKRKYFQADHGAWSHRAEEQAQDALLAFHAKLVHNENGFQSCEHVLNYVGSVVNCFTADAVREKVKTRAVDRGIRRMDRKARLENSDYGDGVSYSMDDTTYLGSTQTEDSIADITEDVAAVRKSAAKKRARSKVLRSRKFLDHEQEFADPKMILAAALDFTSSKDKILLKDMMYGRTREMIACELGITVGAIDQRLRRIGQESAELAGLIEQFRLPGELQETLIARRFKATLAALATLQGTQLPRDWNRVLTMGKAIVLPAKPLEGRKQYRTPEQTCKHLLKLWRLHQRMLPAAAA
jgi:hypothetical protein